MNKIKTRLTVILKTAHYNIFEADILLKDIITIKGITETARLINEHVPNVSAFVHGRQKWSHEKVIVALSVLEGEL